MGLLKNKIKINTSLHAILICKIIPGHIIGLRKHLGFQELVLKNHWVNMVFKFPEQEAIQII